MQLNSQTETSALRNKAISSAGWSFAAKFSRQFFQLLFQVLLARLLSPDDFGMLGMILVFSAFADILKKMGLGAALIQRKDITTNHLNSVFWINIATGLFLFIVFQLTASSIAAFYKLPPLKDVIRVYAVVYFIGSINIVQEALLQKRLQFKRLFFIEIISVLAGGIIAMILAFRGFGVWTLVWQYLVIAGINSIVLWLTSDWRPSFRFHMSSFKELRSFGTNLLGHDLLSFVSRNIDNLLVGKFLGAAALGIYSRAYFLMLQPVNITSQVLERVMFPVLSRMQHDLVLFKTTYLKSLRLVAFGVFPAIAYIFVMANPLIEVLLGPQWLEVAFLLQVFCIYGIVDTIGVTIGWIYKSIGRTKMMFRWGIISTAIVIIAIVTGLQWGIRGVAVTYTCFFLVFLWLPGWWLAFRFINLTVWEMFKNLAPPFFATIIAGFVMAFSNYLLPPVVPPILACMIVLIGGVASYLLAVRIFDPQSLAFFKSLCSRMTKKFSTRKIKFQHLD